MDLFEMMERLQVERTVKAIEVAARAVADTSERLTRRTDFWAKWENDVGVRADFFVREAADKYAHATTEEQRDDATDEMKQQIQDVGELLAYGAERLAEDAKEDEDARRAAAGHGTLEGHLRHPHEVP